MSEQMLGRFTDVISGALCALVLPETGQAGVEHPGCRVLADLSVELDAFYCRCCGLNGRISGAWCVGLLDRARAAS